MSLSSRDRQALESIEAELTASDQRLAAMLTAYSRLTAGEAMPVREMIRAGWLSRPGPAAAGSRGDRRARLLMALWVAVSIALIAIAATVGRGGPRPCAAPGSSGLAATGYAAARHGITEHGITEHGITEHGLTGRGTSGPGTAGDAAAGDAAGGCPARSPAQGSQLAGGRA